MKTEKRKILRNTEQDGLVQVLVETSADQVTYSNTTSGLQSSNIKSAIDEVSGKIDTLERDVQNAGKVDDVKINNVSIVSNKNANIVTDEAYNSSTNKIATQKSVTNHNTDTNSHSDIRNNISNIETDVTNIKKLIPTQATETNQLADKNFVNSSISTATATFRGTVEGSTADVALGTISGMDINDYAYWKHTDSVGNVVYSRYKYNGTAWEFEYDLNNSSFTASQWAAINSGISSNIVETIVPNTRKINNKPLSSDVTLSLDDVADGSSRKLSDYYLATNPNGYTKTEPSTTNGNIKINGTETKVYELPSNVIQSGVATDNNYTNQEKEAVATIANKANAVSQTPANYSCVHVNTEGIVENGGQIIEFGTAGQTTPSASLCYGGLFFELQ